MSDPIERWGAYARLQNKLRARNCLDSISWGVEAGLDRLLEAEPAGPAEGARVVASASRRERDRAQLRRRYLLVPASTQGHHDVVAARQQLQLVARAVGQEAFALLRALAAGYTYEELAAASQARATTIRSRVHRLRVELNDSALAV